MIFTDALQDLIPILNDAGERIDAKSKLFVHQEALFHEAFSVFVLNEKGELLLQKRASHKYHSPDLWTNTVCGHPYPKEDNGLGAKRRLFEELGLQLELTFIDKFSYKSPPLHRGLVEHELDYLYFAKWQGETMQLNPDEVSEVRWITQADLEKELDAAPQDFTYWLLQLYQNGFLEKFFTL